ncbi:MAG TPA: metallophosphoesterase, partial [Chitinophagaceae bacterium]|nr:metallophosphoesterase [Chitinophagaceae bacterium]
MSSWINNDNNNNSRRDFLKKAALAGMGSTLGSTAIAATGELAKEVTEGLPGRFSILYTSDIHAQLHTHDEFFWENEKPVYRRRGGLAVLKTMINHFRKQNPGNTLLIDGGDYFHGSAVASLTEGEALIPLLNDFNYDLILPGNWEVVYKKKKMLFDMGHATAAKICANMWHKTNDADNGELIYPPYWIKYIAG